MPRRLVPGILVGTTGVVPSSARMTGRKPSKKLKRFHKSLDASDAAETVPTTGIAIGQAQANRLKSSQNHHDDPKTDIETPSVLGSSWCCQFGVHN